MATILGARVARLAGLLLLAAALPSLGANNVTGAWLSPTDNNWPLIPIHAVLTPDGRVLTYGTDGNGAQTGYFIYDVWDPSAGLTGGHVTLNNMTLTDIFCSSQVVIPSSGSVFIAGGDNWTGTSTTNTGNNNSNVFSNGTLSRGNNMNRARWYSSSTVLTSGEIYIQGGSSGEDRPEVRQLDGTFRLLTGVNTSSLASLFPRDFLAPDGRIFGYDTNGNMYYVNATGNGTLSGMGAFSSAYAGWTSSAAMFRPGKILQFGGNSNGAIVIDINGATPTVTPTGVMSSQRQWVTATVLPNGKVLATGGSQVDNQLTGVNNSAEIWDPATGTWTVGTSGSRARLYHSTALLLPDASVLVAGGGAPGPLNNQHAEIYYPPYLYNSSGAFAARPSISSAPDTIGLGTNFSVGVGTANISRVTLIKTGSVTHSVNMDQRFLELTFTSSSGTLFIQAPSSAATAPPGYYLLFVLDNNGVPSVGKIIRMAIPGSDATPPVVTITGPTSAATYTTATSSLTISGTASDDVGVTQVSWANDRGGTGSATGTTSWSASGLVLQSGTNVVTVTARDAAGNTSSDTLTVTYTPVIDTTPPGVTITGPTSAATYSTAANPLTISGTASDNVGVTQVTWVNDRGGSGSATGTTAWSVSGLVLQSGTNIVTVTARDAAGNANSDTLTVTYTPGSDAIPPAVTITGPTSAATYSTATSPLTISGTASDNVLVTQVRWVNDRGGSGTATGTSAWTVSGAVLQSGTNVLTVTALDAVGNSSTDTLTVAYLPPAPASGLVAAYSFDEGSGTAEFDRSGMSNDGTLLNGPTWTTGKHGGALQFDGVNDLVKVNDANSLDLSTAATFEAWVYPTVSLSGWRTILQKEAAAYYFTASSDGGANQPASGGTFNGACCASVYAAAPLPANTWTHVAATYNGSQLIVYVNGAQVATLAKSGAYEQNANPLWMGGNALYGEYFQGKLDDIRIYNRVLTPTEIQTDMGVAVGATTNRAPTVVNPGNQAGIAGVPVNLPVSATDPDGDALSYSATGLPAGLTIGSASGVISGTPLTAGSSTVVITVSDGKASTAASLTWTITAVNPLVVDPMPVQAPQLVNTAITYTASAHNGVNTQYKWSFGDGSESGWSSSPTITHTFTKPTIYWVAVTATDDRGIQQSQTFSQLIHFALTSRQPAVSSNIAIGGGRLWVVNQDNDTVSAFDLATNQKLAEIAVGAAPRTAAIAPDGSIWVTNRAAASISVIDPTTLSVSRTIGLPYASQPYGLVFAPDGSAAYVALEALGRVARLDPSSGSQLISASVGPTPRQLAVSADTASLYVSRFITPKLPGENTALISTSVNGVDVGGEVPVIDTATMTVRKTIVLRHSDDADFENSGSGVPNYLGAAVISPDGTSAWVPSKKDNIKRGTLRSGLNLNHQNTVRSISSRIDLATDAENFGARIDHDNSSLASAAAFDHYGVFMFVALETSREVAVVDVHNHVEFFRIAVGRAPQGLAVSPDGYRLYVSNFMDRTVGVYDLTQLIDQGQWQVPLLATLQSVATEKLSPTVLKGKQFFYDARDARLAREGYMSCATCHRDGGSDGRTWDMTGFGEGLRNTIALNGRAGMGHGFLHWTGNFDEVQDFEGQIRNLSGGTGLMSDTLFLQGTRSQPLGDPKAALSSDLDALAAYVASLNVFASSPYRNSDGSLTADGVAGKAIFANLNCAQCHGGPNFTDSAAANLRDIGTIKQPTSGQRLGSALTGIDVPTLRDVWMTAPYLHDGSAGTLELAVRAHSAVAISDTDLAVLVAYLKQIDGTEPAPPPVSNSPPVVTNPGSQGGTVGLAITALQIVATDGNNDPLTFSATGLPAGLSISSSGLVTGTPTAAGTSSVTVTANDGKGGTGSATFSWTIAAANVAPVVTNPGSQGGTVGLAITALQIVATDGNNDPLTFSATGLPAGLSISSGGLVTGTPTTAGTSSVTATANDGKGGTGSATFSWTIAAANVAPVVTNPGSQGGTVGLAITAPQIVATDGNNDPLTFSATGLPAGLSISSSGLVTGTPTAAGTSSVTATANDGKGGTGSATFSWTIAAANVAPVVTNPGSQGGTVGLAITALQIVATDGNNDPLTFSATGLPAGLSISSSGLVTGTPTAAGTSSVTATANDGKGGTGSATFSWTIAAANVAPVVTNPGSQGGTVGLAITALQIVATDGNNDPLTFSATGLPAGLSISSGGLVTGTPTTAGTSSVTATANDGKGGTGSATFSWTIALDTQVPAAPANLRASTTSGSVQLSWTAATDNVRVVGYYIHRSSKNGVLGPQVGTTTSTSWVDSGVTAGAKYTYAAKAYDAAGNVSGRSNFASVTVR